MTILGYHTICKFVCLPDKFEYRARKLLAHQCPKFKKSQKKHCLNHMQNNNKTAKIQLKQKAEGHLICGKYLLDMKKM